MGIFVPKHFPNLWISETNLYSNGENSLDVQLKRDTHFPSYGGDLLEQTNQQIICLGLYKNVPSVHVADNAVARRLLDVLDVSRHVSLRILELRET